MKPLQGRGIPLFRCLFAPSYHVQAQLADVLRAYEAVLKRRHFQPTDDTFFYSVILKLSLRPGDGSWWHRLQKEVESNAQQFAGAMHHARPPNRRCSCSQQRCSCDNGPAPPVPQLQQQHCHHVCGSAAAHPRNHSLQPQRCGQQHKTEQLYSECSAHDAAAHRKRLALAALWTWRCHSAFDCHRGGGGGIGIGGGVGGGGASSCGKRNAGTQATGDRGAGLCRRKVPCRVCAHASAQLLQRTTREWRRQCAACQQRR